MVTNSKASKRILLCADEESLKHPSLLGLGDVELEGCPWLEVRSNADEIRQIVQQPSDFEEVWISSSDEVSSLNLAAALHQDVPGMSIRLIMFSPTGSFLSNATAVGACDVLNEVSFPRRFAEMSSPKPQVHSGEPDPAPLDIVAKRREPRGAVLPVMSASGGAGKSALSAVLSTLVSQRGASVIVLDLDLQFGDMHKLLGCPHPITVNDVLNDGEALEAIVSSPVEPSASGSVALVAAPARLEHADLIIGHQEELLDLCASLFDVVVVNTGAQWGEQHAQLLERSASPVFLIDQRTSSVLGCKHALELCTRMGIATSSIIFSLNRCGREAMFTGIDVAMALQGSHVVEIKDGGHEVEELLSAGMVHELCTTKNEMVKSADELLDEVAALDPRIPARKVSRHQEVLHGGRTLLGRRRRARSEVREPQEAVSIEDIQAGLNAMPALAMGR